MLWMLLSATSLSYFNHCANAFVFPHRARLQQSKLKYEPLTMVMGGIAEKMGSIVEFISGQSRITEDNIEDTLKVMGANDLIGLQLS